MTDHKHTKETRELSCDDVMRVLFDYVDGELDDMSSAEIDHHLEHCRSCMSRTEFEAVLKKRVKGAGKERAPDNLVDRLDKLVGNF